MSAVSVVFAFSQLNLTIYTLTDEKNKITLKKNSMTQNNIAKTINPNNIVKQVNQKSEASQCTQVLQIKQIIHKNH